MLSVSFSVIFQLLGERILFFQNATSTYCCSMHSLDIGSCLGNDLLVELGIKGIHCVHITCPWCCGSSTDTTVCSTEIDWFLDCIGSDYGLLFVSWFTCEEVWTLLLQFNWLHILVFVALSVSFVSYDSLDVIDDIHTWVMTVLPSGSDCCHCCGTSGFTTTSVINVILVEFIWEDCIQDILGSGIGLVLRINESVLVDWFNTGLVSVQRNMHVLWCIDASTATSCSFILKAVKGEEN